MLVIKYCSEQNEVIEKVAFRQDLKVCKRIIWTKRKEGRNVASKKTSIIKAVGGRKISYF